MYSNDALFPNTSNLKKNLVLLIQLVEYVTQYTSNSKKSPLKIVQITLQYESGSAYT